MFLELWCWGRLMRIPWTARRSNQSILKEISPEYSLEGLMLKLKLQYFGHLMQRTDSLEKTRCWERLKAGGEEDNRGWDDWMASPTQWTWVWVNSGSWWWIGRPGMLQSMWLQRIIYDWATELNWTGKCKWQSVNISWASIFASSSSTFKKKKVACNSRNTAVGTNENSQIILLAFYSINMALKIKYYKGNPV